MHEDIATAHFMQQEALSRFIEKAGVIPGYHATTPEQGAQDKVLDAGKATIDKAGDHSDRQRSRAKPEVARELIATAKDGIEEPRQGRADDQQKCDRHLTGGSKSGCIPSTKKIVWERCTMLRASHASQPSVCCGA